MSEVKELIVFAIVIFVLALIIVPVPRSAMILRMRREGEFVANWSDVHTGCGTPKLGPNVYRYVCEIESTRESLDENGFILDNMEVDAYFQSVYSARVPAKSCERIAINAVEHIRRMLRDPLRVAVTIYGSPQAGLTAEWQAQVDRDVNEAAELIGDFFSRVSAVAKDAANEARKQRAKTRGEVTMLRQLPNNMRNTQLQSDGSYGLD